MTDIAATLTAATASTAARWAAWEAVYGDDGIDRTASRQCGDTWGAPDPWGFWWEFLRDLLIAAYHAAQKVEEGAWTSAGEALADLPWGRQPGGGFMTDRAADWSGTRRRTLYGPQKVQIASVLVKWSGGERRSKLTIYDPDEAAAAARAERTRRRELAAEYEITLAAAAAALFDAGVTALSDGLRVGAWEYQGGQEGGRLVYLDEYGPGGDRGWHEATCSARGALRRAYGPHPSLRYSEDGVRLDWADRS